MLINKCELPVRKHFNDSRTSIEYSNDIDDIYQNMEGYNRNEKWKILIIFNNNIADVHSNKKLNPIVTDFFIRGRKLNIILLFLLHNHILCTKKYGTKFNTLFHYENSKRTYKNKILNLNLYKKCTAKSHLSLVTDATLASGNPPRFRNNLLERI